MLPGFFKAARNLRETFGNRPEAWRVTYSWIDNLIFVEYKANRRNHCQKQKDKRMNSENIRYENFLTQLRQLSFCTTQTVVKKRKDLCAFRARDGSWITDIDSSFGAAYGELTEEERAHTESLYRYYYGHADYVFYSMHTKSIKQECFMPVSSVLSARKSPPVVGEIIFGRIEERGPEGKRFFWWNFATREDRNFANLLSGRMTYSTGKLETKLVIRNREGPPDWTLFLLAKALYFRDVDYFVEQAQGFGKQPPQLCFKCQIDKWLWRNVSDLLPKFYEEFMHKISACAATPREMSFSLP